MLTSRSRSVKVNIEQVIRSISNINGLVASTSKLAASSPTDHYRITLRRSAIGLPKKFSQTLASLGLRKRLQSVYLPQRSDIAGMILGVKELVHVENVRRLGQAKGVEIESEESEEYIARALVSPIWVNEKDEVVDWGRRAAHRAPRGYKIVGNISNEMRNEEIQMMQKQENPSRF